MIAGGAPGGGVKSVSSSSVLSSKLSKVSIVGAGIHESTGAEEVAMKQLPDHALQ